MVKTNALIRAPEPRNKSDKGKDFYILTNIWAKIVANLLKISDKNIALLDGLPDLSRFIFMSKIENNKWAKIYKRY